MKALLADANIERHVIRIVSRMMQPPWREFWDDLGIGLVRFRDIGLSKRTPDNILWIRCQNEGLVLLTSNRNEDDSTSLGTTIREHNTVASLPVFTLADADRVLTDRAYFERVVEHLLDIDKVLGTGRLYLP